MAPVLGLVITTGFGLIVAGVGLHVLNRGLDRRRRASRIAGTQTTRIRQLRPGPVEITGTARAPEGASLPPAPISDGRALVSHVAVEDRSGNNYEVVHEARTLAPFVVDDGTGQVRVDPPESTTLNLDTREIDVPPGQEPPPDVRRFVEESEAVDEAASWDLGLVTTGEHRHYTEGVIQPGETVYVLGEAVEVQAGWGDRRYEITAPAGAGELVLSDMSQRELIADEKREGLVRIVGGALIVLFGLLFVVLPWMGVGTWHI